MGKLRAAVPVEGQRVRGEINLPSETIEVTGIVQWVGSTQFTVMTDSGIRMLFFTDVKEIYEDG